MNGDCVPNIDIRAPSWCPDCGALLPERPAWHPVPGPPPPGATVLLVALPLDDGGAYTDIAEHHPARGWSLVGGGACAPIAWAPLPPLPEWLA